MDGSLEFVMVQVCLSRCCCQISCTWWGNLNDALSQNKMNGAELSSDHILRVEPSQSNAIKYNGKNGAPVVAEVATEKQVDESNEAPDEDDDELDDFFSSM